MKATYWTKLCVMCVVALVSGWQANNVLAAPPNSILDLGKIGKPGSGQFQPLNPPPKSGPSVQLDPKFQLNNNPFGKNTLKINPDWAGKLKPSPNGSGGVGGGGKPLGPGKWWDTPFGQAVAGGIHDRIAGHGNYPIWPGPANYGNSGGYYDYGANYASPGYNLPPANVLPSAPMRVAIVNPASTGVTIQFVVDGQAGSLAPGQRAEIGQFSPQVVEFDRGGQFGVGRYGLEEGTFSFAVTPQGIELYHGAYTSAQ